MVDKRAAAPVLLRYYSGTTPLLGRYARYMQVIYPLLGRYSSGLLRVSLFFAPFDLAPYVPPVGSRRPFGVRLGVTGP